MFVQLRCTWVEGLVEQELELAPQAKVMRQQKVLVEANANYYNS